MKNSNLYALYDHDANIIHKIGFGPMIYIQC